MASKSPLQVSLVGITGTLSMPVAGLYEVLNAFPMVAGFNDAVPASPPFEVDIVGAERETITSASGLPVSIHRSFREIDRTDIVIVPVMASDADYQPGGHAECVDWMKRMHDNGAILCSACTGVLVLAETGLLDGRQATMHWAFAPVFRKHFPEVELCLNEVLVTTGERNEFVMSGGTTSWQDLVLYLIGRFVHPTTAHAMAKFLLLERHSEGQAPYLPFSPETRHGDSLILGLQQWLKANFSVASPVAIMAHQSNLSLRTFERRFKQATGHSPIAYVQYLRVEEAKRRLERTDKPIDQVSWEVGYEDAAAFRRLFKRVARVTPGAYRRKFRVANFPGPDIHTEGGSTY